jgi:hypothetical protein
MFKPLFFLFFVPVLSFGQLTIQSNDSHLINEFFNIYDEFCQTNDITNISFLVVFDNESELTINFVDQPRSNYIIIEIFINQHLIYKRQKQMFLISLIRSTELANNKKILKSWDQLLKQTSNLL